MLIAEHANGLNGRHQSPRSEAVESSCPNDARRKLGAANLCMPCCGSMCSPASPERLNLRLSNARYARAMTAMALPALALWPITFVALIVAAVRAAIPRGHRRTVRLRVLARALLPHRIVRSRSGRLDIAAFLFAALLAGGTISWALIAAETWMHAATALLGPGPMRPLLPPWLSSIIVTVALFFAYEAAYWLNHWLSHHIPVLWAFHKTHHTAESLSLLTNFRVHPVDTIVFYNMAAFVTGIVAALLLRLIGSSAQLTVGAANLLVFVSTILLSYLQHSQFWIVLPGRWGAFLLSPAHHQLHHSADPQHHGRNFGSTLALFDWFASTLLAPTPQRQSLRFGIDHLDHDPHGLGSALVQPFVDAARSMAPVQPAADTPRAA